MSILTETSAVYAQLEACNRLTGQAVAGTGNGALTFPDVSLMEYAELLTLVSSSIEQGIEFINGIAQDTIFNSASTSRELSMCSAGKSSLYANLPTSYNAEAEFYKQSKSFSEGVMKGGRTNGSQC